jgi:thiol-disulfide isomerase/thioredoxin
VLWASALAVVVLTIATVVAFTAGGGDDAGVEKLDPNATIPADGNPLLGEDLSGEALPALTFQRFDGTEVSLADYAGRPLVINFWASWCTPCIAEMPTFEAVHQAVGEEVVFLGLNVTDGVEPAEAMIERTGVTYDLGRDPSGDVLAELGGVNMPTTVFVAADGTIVGSHAGQLDEAELIASLADQLGVTVAVPSSWSTPRWRTPSASAWSPPSTPAGSPCSRRTSPTSSGSRAAPTRTPGARCSGRWPSAGR